MEFEPSLGSKLPHTWNIIVLSFVVFVCTCNTSPPSDGPHLLVMQVWIRFIKGSPKSQESDIKIENTALAINFCCTMLVKSSIYLLDIHLFIQVFTRYLFLNR